MTAEEIIKEKGLKLTPLRIAIVKGLVETEQPLSEAALKSMLPEGFDRVTFYRTMKTLQESEIIHSIVQDEQNVVYALNHHHEHKHAHFVCDSCHKTVCLEDEPALDATLPAGFKSYRTDIVIHGICDECGNLK